MLAAFLRNHPLANLTFGLVLVAGFLAYGLLPHQQDPAVNFNWIVITTILPGASAQDIEKKVTDPLNANTLTLVERIQAYISERNAVQDQTGVSLTLIDDQTVPTRTAIGLMENNAVLGLLLVLVTAWLFLGTRIAIFTSLGIPFSLAGTFLVLLAVGETLN